MNYESKQPLICLLLCYYNEGSFTSFKKICELAYPTLSKDSYFYSNIFLALNIAGFIEIKNNYTALMRWYSVVNGKNDCILINSLKAKIVGISNKWFKESIEQLSPLIVDQNNNCLIHGVLNPDFEVNEDHNFLNENFFAIFPKYPTVESIVGYEEKNLRSLAGNVETFDYVLKKWVHIDVESIVKPSLIRITKEYTGIHYYIFYPNIDLYYHIKYPEWGFIVAAVQLAWDRKSFFKYDQNTLFIDTQFKLPTIILRFLFASSEKLKIGKRLEFININKKCAEAFFFYITNI